MARIAAAEESTAMDIECERSFHEECGADTSCENNEPGVSTQTEITGKVLETMDLEMQNLRKESSKLLSKNLCTFPLIRLRLNVSTTFLAYMFNIYLPTASRIFKEVLNVMYIQLQRMVRWPEKEALKKPCLCYSDVILGRNVL